MITFYTATEVMVREIGAGIWLITSTALTLALLNYVIRNSREVQYNPAFWVAIAFTFFCLGSAIRGTLTWFEFYYRANFWNPVVWLETWPWYGLSVGLNIVGALIAIWMLTPANKRLWFTGGLLFLAATLPFSFYYFNPTFGFGPDEGAITQGYRQLTR